MHTDEIESFLQTELDRAQDKLTNANSRKLRNPFSYANRAYGRHYWRGVSQAHFRVLHEIHMRRKVAETKRNESGDTMPNIFVDQPEVPNIQRRNTS